MTHFYIVSYPCVYCTKHILNSLFIHDVYQSCRHIEINQEGFPKDKIRNKTKQTSHVSLFECVITSAFTCMFVWFICSFLILLIQQLEKEKCQKSACNILLLEYHDQHSLV